ncbi:hypothetical protein QZM18_28110 [Burkholderia diffusa]|uniref:hypothetical protein n=1 Tax=Burkholderia diffusa TaxID=488732 RepID=UPI00264D9619|nr:hypothetical protein [Burkholderia diffusa]MDN7907954.1 hypothetical protein [Burkholderia diffusa]
MKTATGVNVVENPTIKQIIEQIGAFVDIEAAKFQDILIVYVEYLKTLPSKGEFRIYAGDSGCAFFEEKLNILGLNAKGILSSSDLVKEKVALLNLADDATAVFRKIIKLLTTGLATEKGMLEYSNYPEYLAADMLEISVSVLYDVGLNYAESFSQFCEKYTFEP